MMELDLYQKAAVETTFDQVLVTAGPGSGKTRVLVARAAHLVESGVSPEEIMITTFTRKAAAEIKQRLAEEIGDSLARRVTAGTLHSIGLSMIKKFDTKSFYNAQQFTVYSPAEEKLLINQCAHDIGVMKAGKWVKPKKQMMSAIEFYYDTGKDPDHVQHGYPLWNAVMNELKRNNAITFGQILIRFIGVIPKVNTYMHYSHLLVDECQDLDLMQWNIIAIKMGSDKSMFMVGDIDQSIYEWRGAKPGYLQNILKYATVYELRNNYRCPAEIVEIADNLIRNNKNRIPVAHQAHKGCGDIQVFNEMGTAMLVKWISQNSDDKPVAILSRQHILLKKLSELLTVDHEYIGANTSLLATPGMIRLNAVIKLYQNRFDRFSFQLARKEVFDIYDKDYHTIVESANLSSSSLVDSWLLTRFGSGHQVYFTPIEREDEMQTLIDRIWGALGQKFSLDCLRFVQDFIDAFPGKAKVKDYLEWIATYDIQDEIKAASAAHGVRLMTIHAAKGLEFENVVIIGCNDGILPSSRSLKSGDIEEERRLMYVAVTRAEKNVYFMVRPTEDGKYNNPKSVFLAEMGV